MEDMIHKIVEMDKMARDMTAEAQKSKVDYEQEIIRTKEKIKNDFLERALKRVEINRNTAKQKADDVLKDMVKTNASIIENLNKIYSENGDKWVDEIFCRVVGE